MWCRVWVTTSPSLETFTATQCKLNLTHICFYHTHLKLIVLPSLVSLLLRFRKGDYSTKFIPNEYGKFEAQLGDYQVHSQSDLGKLSCGLTVGQQSKLAGMNDDVKSFKVIADYIEKKIKGVVKKKKVAKKKTAK